MYFIFSLHFKLYYFFIFFKLVVETVGPKRKISVKEKVDSFVPWFETKFRKAWTLKTVTRRLPFLTWMKTYNSDDAIGDLVAGVTVGLTVIPQSLAYANIAGLPAQVYFLT